MRLFALSLLLITTITYADARVIQPAKIVCSEWADLDAVTKEVKEDPAFRFSALRIINGVKRLVPGMIFLNKGTTSFTIIERWDEDQYCVIALGEAMLPYETY